MGVLRILRLPLIRGTILVGPNKKGSSIQGSMLGSPCSRKLPSRITLGFISHM